MSADRKKQHSALWKARNRRIWGTAHQIGMEEADLRYLVGEATGLKGEHNISGLTEAQQAQVLSALQILRAHQRQRRREQKKRIDTRPKGGGSTAATWRQVELLRTLAGQIGWGDGALRMWLSKWFRVDHEKWLTASKATRAITAMKAMVGRQKAAKAE